MQKALLLLLLLASGCASLEKRNLYAIDRSTLDSSIEPMCMIPEFNDPAKLSINGQEMKVFWTSRYNALWMGPLFLPIFPIFWHSPRPEGLTLYLYDIPKNSISWSWKVRLDEKNPWIEGNQKDSQVDFLTSDVGIPNLIELSVEGKIIRFKRKSEMQYEPLLGFGTPASRYGEYPSCTRIPPDPDN